MATPSVFLEAGVVFSDLSGSVACIQHLVSRLSQTDALLWCARANLIVANPFNKDEQRRSYLVETFFPEPDERQRVDRWLKKNAASNGTAFFRAQFLELAYWVARFSKNSPDDGTSFVNPRARRVFGQAALVASSLWSDRVYRNLSTLQTADTARLRTEAMPMARSSMAENSRGSIPYVAIGRGALLWSRYVPAQWSECAKVFKEATGLDVDAHFRGFSAILAQHIDIRPEQLTAETGSAGFFSDAQWKDNTELRETFPLLVRNLSVSLDDLVNIARRGEHDEFIHAIKTRPILCTSDGRHIVLDPVFLAEAAAVGPLFSIADHMRSDEKRRDRCFAHFGSAFESYVADLVSARYPDRPPLARRAFTRVILRKGKTNHGEIDAAIVTGACEVCLIEAKAVFIPNAAALDPDTYHSVVRAKYGASEKLKGAAQLGRIARVLATTKLDELPRELMEPKKVLTVLLVYDHHLDSPGHAAFLKQEFAVALEPDETLADGWFRKAQTHVSAPVVITIDDFEWLEASLANFSFGEFLTEYSRADPERASDVRSYAFSSRFWKQMRNPEAASQSAVALLQDLGLKAFGAEWVSQSANLLVSAP